MDKQKIIHLAISALRNEYPKANCSLIYKNPLNLLIATRLSAQCTDARVNLVTPKLFKKFPTLESLCNASVQDIEDCIHSCGLYKTKARDIIAMCQLLKQNYNGIIPDNIEELIKLPGVGRKTANLIVGDIFHKPAVVVDTHCIRITKRLGLHKEKNAEKIEKILKNLLPPDESNDFCHRLVLHGRAVCCAKLPKCKNCVMRNFCKSLIFL
ncbi:MAG: endonuclease III [Oscillospiraceae bacterium]|jgi:endonuclease-3|nr:endonuclease III [Oscillospiraceae bacterium]